MRKLLLLLALAPMCAYSQAFRVDPAAASTISSNVPPGAYPPVLAIPGATISFSGGSTYTDLTGVTACPTNAPVVIQGTNVCVSTADAQGNFGFYLKAGNYTYTVTTPQGASYGPLTLSVPTGGGGGGGGCTPGGPGGAVQFNNGSGGCSGVSNLSWNNGSTLLSITAANATSPGIDVTVGFVQSQTGFLAKTSSATLFNAIQAPGGGMQALSFTAANYVQTGQSNGVPSATTDDMFHAGAMYYDTGVGAEQVYNGSAWVSIGGGTGCTVSTSAGNVLFSTGSGCGGSNNLAFNTSLQKLTVTGIASTAAFDVPSGFIQTEGGIVTNVGAWNAFNTNTDGMVARGHVVQQNVGNTAGGYINFVPITYPPNGSTCHDQYGNVVNQPLPLPGISSWALGTATSTFASGSISITLSSLPAGVGVESQIVGLGIPRGDYIVGVSGSTITLAVATASSQTSATMTFFNNNLWEWDAPSSSMPDNGSCGTPLPANTLYGMNTNGYYFARGGFATDLPYFNSIQSLYGGVFGRALFTADTFNQTSGVQCAVLGTCGGAYYNTGGSNGIPTPLVGDVFHGGAFYWDTSTFKQQIFNGTGWRTLCYTSGPAGAVLFDNNAGACGETSALNWTGSTFQVLGNVTVSGSITVGSCTGCGGGGGAVSSVSGAGNISVSPSTGAVVVSITSSPSWSSQFISGTTNCTATGTTSCFQQSSGTFQIFGNGNAAFQTATVNNVVINSGGTANCQSTGTTACFQQASGTFVIQGNGDGFFQAVTSNLFANTGWNYNSFGTSTWTASKYYVNSTEGHTGSTCSHWTEGLCDAP